MGRMVNSDMQSLIERIPKARHSDLELEKTMCLELLELSEKEDNMYGRAFGNIYLGNYYVVTNDSHGCAPYLLKGLSMSLEQDFEELQILAYCLLGVYFEMIGDEHSAMEYHMNGVQIARKCKDRFSECKCYTNIGNDFQQYGNYHEAKHYCLAAMELIKEMEEQGGLSEEALYLKLITVSNLAEQSIVTRDLKPAWQYCVDCEEILLDLEIKDVYVYRNWCYYFTALLDREQAFYYAEKLLTHEKFLNENKLAGFDMAIIICDNMLTLGNKELAFEFFWVMCRAVGEDNGEFKFSLLDMNMKLLLRFGSPQDVELAYKEYYENHVKLEENRDNIRSEAMMSKIYLYQVVKDQEDMKEKKQSLETDAHVDSMTQLYNRRYFNTLISRCYSEPAVKKIGAIMLDVDNFKEYNDHYGHLKGDQVLKDVADCMMKYKSDHIYVGRFGGDEFLCLCVNLENEEIEAFIGYVQEEIYRKNFPHVMSSCSDRVTLSIGYVNEGMNRKIQTYELFEMADRALYKSKLKGKNVFTREQYGWDEMV